MYGSEGGAGVIAIRTKNQFLKQQQEIVEREELLFNKVVEKGFFKNYTKRGFDDFSATSTPADDIEALEFNTEKSVLNYRDLHSKNPDALKRLAFYLDAENRPDLSAILYKEILMQRPSYAQSFRDLAQAYLKNNQTQKSWETYMKYILRGKKMDQSEGIEGIVYDEIWNLERNYNISKEDISLIRLSDRYEETPPQPIRFVVEWVNPLDQFSLTFVNPNQQVHTFSHQLPAQQEAILNEQINGYSATSFSWIKV